MTMGFRMPEAVDQHELQDRNHGAFNPDRRIDISHVTDAIADVFIPDRRIGKLYTSRDERISQAEGTDGKWSGEPGNSWVRPNLDTEAGRAAANKLAEYGLKDVRFRDGVVDFSKCCEESATIPNMTSKIGSNRRQALDAVAEKWNEQGKTQDDGSKWTRDAVAGWASKNGLEFHECSDMKTCQFVPAEIHAYFKHFGGRAECKIRDGEIRREWSK